MWMCAKGCGRQELQYDEAILWDLLFVRCVGVVTGCTAHIAFTVVFCFTYDQIRRRVCRFGFDTLPIINSAVDGSVAVGDIDVGSRG